VKVAATSPTVPPSDLPPTGGGAEQTVAGADVAEEVGPSDRPSS
jgi:hypothetical protein